MTEPTNKLTFKNPIAGSKKLTTTSKTYDAKPADQLAKITYTISYAEGATSPDAKLISKALSDALGKIKPQKNK